MVNHDFDVKAVICQDIFMIYLWYPHCVSELKSVKHRRLFFISERNRLNHQSIFKIVCTKRTKSYRTQCIKRNLRLVGFFIWLQTVAWNTWQISWEQGPEGQHFTLWFFNLSGLANHFSVDKIPFLFFYLHLMYYAFVTCVLYQNILRRQTRFFKCRYQLLSYTL